MYMQKMCQSLQGLVMRLSLPQCAYQGGSMEDLILYKVNI